MKILEKRFSTRCNEEHYHRQLDGSRLKKAEAYPKGMCKITSEGLITGKSRVVGSTGEIMKGVNTAILKEDQLHENNGKDKCEKGME